MNTMLSAIFDEVMSGCLGGEINSDACEMGENYTVLHCWDGRRFILSCAQEPNGCAYDPKTGQAT